VGNILFVLVVAVIASLIIFGVNRRRRGLVAERGLSVGADLAAMRDAPQVRVRALVREAPEHYRLVLAPEPGADDGPGPASDLEYVVVLRDEDFGLELLHKWQRSQAVLAFVTPPGSRLLRLRSIDDLQPVTLRRVDE